MLGGLAALLFLTTIGWWSWDGVRLLRGKVGTGGEQLAARHDAEEAGAAR